MIRKFRVTAITCASPTEEGHLVIYDLHSLKQTNELTFASRISAYLFSEDGKRLFVLTNDQTAFILDVPRGNCCNDCVKMNLGFGRVFLSRKV